MKSLKTISIAFFVACGLLGANFSFGQAIPKIPDDVSDVVSPKDVIEVFCLMTKWKSGDFFAALDGLNSILVPALQELKEFGIDSEVPDFGVYQANGQAKLNAICQAENYTQAQSAVNDFVAFGEQTKQELSGLNVSLGDKLKTKGLELQEKVKKELDLWAAQEAASIAKKVENKAKEVASAMQAQLESDMPKMGFKDPVKAQAYAQSRAQQIGAESQKQAMALKDKLQKEMESKANAKATEILGFDAVKFKTLGEKMQNIEGLLGNYIAQKKQDYKIYRDQAMTKRKEIILKVLDARLKQVEDKINEKAEVLEQARQNDSQVKSATVYIAQLQIDKQEFAQKIEQALDNNSEERLRAAAIDLKNKWNNIKNQLEADLAKKQSVFEICSSTAQPLVSAKKQIEQGLEKINQAEQEINEKSSQGNCEQSPSACQTVATILIQIKNTKVKLNAMLEQINQAQTKCQVVKSDSPFDSELVGLIVSLKNSNQALRDEIANLKVQWQENKVNLEKELAKKPK